MEHTNESKIRTKSESMNNPRSTGSVVLFSFPPVEGEDQISGVVGAPRLSCLVGPWRPLVAKFRTSALIITPNRKKAPQRQIQWIYMNYLFSIHHCLSPSADLFFHAILPFAYICIFVFLVFPQARKQASVKVGMLTECSHKVYLHLCKLVVTYEALKSFIIVVIISFLKRGRRRERPGTDSKPSNSRRNKQVRKPGGRREVNQQYGSCDRVENIWQNWSHPTWAARWLIPDLLQTQPSFPTEKLLVLPLFTSETRPSSITFNIHLTTLPLASPQKKKKKISITHIEGTVIISSERAVCPNHVMCKWVVLTIAMTAAPAPASAQTNRWKVKSSCKHREPGYLHCRTCSACSSCHRWRRPRVCSPRWSRTSWGISPIPCTPSSPRRWSPPLVVW